jgi:hypothetical protein
MLNTRFKNAHGTGHRWNIGHDGTPDWAALKANVPSLFSEAAHDSRSARYGFVSTAETLRALWAEGWAPVMALEAEPRDADKLGFQKHMVRLRKFDDMATGNGGAWGDGTMARRDGVSELIIVNSFDGSTSYQVLAGHFRFVCANGLITGDRFSEIRVKHTRNMVQGVVEAATEIGGAFHKVDGAIDAMRSINLSAMERRDFAEAAHKLRWPVAIAEDGSKTGGSPISPDQLLIPRRSADDGSDLWRTFNVVQENTIKGGLSGRHDRRPGERYGRRTTSREVGGIDQNVKLNRALWTLAEEAASLKGVKLAA